MLHNIFINPKTIHYTHCHLRILKSISLTGILFLFLAGQIAAQQKTSCFIKTTLGTITIELYPSKAPITVANFLKYVDAHLYDSSSFFRSVTLQNQPKDSIKIEVIQGGNIDSTKDFAPILLETTKHTGILHKNGTISMARSGPNTATSSFFICINDQPALDYGGKRNKDGQGFAAFGKVIKGMDVVKKIQQLYPKQGQYFKPPVLILSVIRK
ncbi:peptidylprolyl isomerase [Ferruginibacter sp. SUN106]|uniref:peptidylprolyl isomerase n=1 Tax=Ferruginibacter sp. SUN106 TaxID=2978348 RepID=UPI003D35DA6B